jgi:hypothetical protein
MAVEVALVVVGPGVVQAFDNHLANLIDNLGVAGNRRSSVSRIFA